MSDTPKLPDECKRLLDNGWMIVLLKGPIGDYTAAAISHRSIEENRAIMAVNKAIREIPDNQLTGDFEPSQALTRLTEKVFGCNVAGSPRAE